MFSLEVTHHPCCWSTRVVDFTFAFSANCDSFVNSTIIGLFGTKISTHLAPFRAFSINYDLHINQLWAWDTEHENLLLGLQKLSVTGNGTSVAWSACALLKVWPTCIQCWELAKSLNFGALEQTNNTTNTSYLAEQADCVHTSHHSLQDKHNQPGIIFSKMNWTDQLT